MFFELLEDLRFPIGFLFSIFSVILLGLGFFYPSKDASGINLNLFAGCLMGVFGVIMLLSSWFSFQKRKK